jgi:putative SbcD/Mre11-related phosphoesterase
MDMEKGLRFVTGEPALKIGRVLVVADLHIGVEHQYRKEGIALPSQSGKLMERLEGLIKRTRAKRLVILGDVKHMVPGTSFQEEREIPAFLRRLLERVEVDVTPGNHDGGIGRLLPKEVVVHPSGGFMLGKTWLCHGHAWPGKDFLKAREVVVGHNHAGVEFRDKLGCRWLEPVWIRAGLVREKIEEKYGKAGERLPELVIMPFFNTFSGMVPVNRSVEEIARRYREGPGPLFRSMDREKARVYMLDGTLLGELGKL